MNMKIYTLLFAFLFVVPIYAQKKSAPKTTFDLPTDSTATKSLPEKKVESEEPELELPEVLILGKDSYRREAGNKKTIPESPTLMQPDSPYDPVTTWFRKQAQKPQAGTGSEKTTQRTWSALKGGSYTTILADIGHWQEFSQGAFQVHGNFNRSAGQYKNSQYSRGALDGQLEVTLSPQATGLVEGSYALNQYGLHNVGYFSNSGLRTASTGQFSSDLLFTPNSFSEGRIGFSVHNLSLQSDTSDTKINVTDDFWYNAHFDYIAHLGKTQIRATGKFLRESFETRNDTSALKSSFGDIGAEVIHPFTRSISAALGAAYQSTTSDTSSAKARVAPFARINFMPSNVFGLSALISTGYQYNTFRQWWEHNKYMTHQVPLKPEEKNLGIHVKADLMLTEQLKLQAGFQRDWMKRIYIWQLNTAENDNAASATNLFDLMKLKARLTEMSIGAMFEIDKKTRVEASFITYGDKVDKDLFSSPMGRLTYRPEFRVPVRARFELGQGVHLESTLDVVGKRRKDITSLETLPPYALMHAELSKQFGQYVTALVSVHNLFDTEYVLWEHYKETGIQILAGVRAQF